MPARKNTATKQTRQSDHDKRKRDLEEMDKIASKSKLTMKDVMEISEKIKAGMNKEFRKTLPRKRKEPGPSTGTLKARASRSGWKAASTSCK